jgi:DNA-binding winged helix-turn-helix (wHTH) protein/predicted ATPase
VRVRFAEFSYDSGARELSRGGSAVPLPKLAFDLLGLLLQERPRVVSRRELLDRLWPDRVVSDAAIASVVRDLRAALGETGRATRLIRTAHGYGFAFAGVAVAEEEDAERAETAAAARRLDSGVAQPARTAPVETAFVPRRRGVGRGAELAALHAAFEQARSGGGSLVCVSGEPGIGKTTLVEDFLAELGDDALLARGRCSERLAGSEAYLPWLEALEGLAGHAARSDVARLMKRVAPGWYAQLTPASREPDPGPRVPARSRERLKRELDVFLQEAAKLHALVLLFEDVHWSDAPTIELLGYVGTMLASRRLLIVGTYRTSELALRRSPFGSLKLDLQSRSLCRELALGFLSLEDVRDYLSLEFPGHRFPGELAAFVRERTEGSPLFMVDLLRDLRSRGFVAFDGGSWCLARQLPSLDRELPESIRSMIQRKIDQLGETDRRLLAAASVRGVEFDSAALATAVERDAVEVEERLEALERVHTFVERTGEDSLPEAAASRSYRFVHSLYQNALYASLGPSRKAALSGAWARVLALRHAADPSEVAADLALLFEAAHAPARSGEHFLLAARRAARLFAHEETSGLCRRGLAQLATLAETAERDRQELDLLLTFGPALTMTRGFSDPEVEIVYTRARELCRRSEAEPRLLPVLVMLCLFYGIRGQGRQARELASRVSALAERSRDSLLLLQARHSQWNVLLGEGDLAAARECLEEAVALYPGQQHPSDVYLYGGHDPGVCSRAFASLAAWACGFPDQALAHAGRSLTLGRQLQEPSSLALGLALVALLHSLRRDPVLARELAADTVALAGEERLAYMAALGRIVLGWAESRLGDASAGLGEMREGLRAADATGARFFRPYWSALIAEAAREAGALDEALVTVDAGLQEARSTGQRFAEAELLRLEGELRLQRGDAAQGERALREGLAVARRQGARLFGLRITLSLARLEAGRGHATEARTQLESAYGWFSEGLETTDLLEASRFLEQLRA